MCRKSDAVARENMEVDVGMNHASRLGSLNRTTLIVRMRHGRAGVRPARRAGAHP
jgi:hypothetical protein